MKLRSMRYGFSLLVALAVVAPPVLAAPFDKGDVNGDNKPGELGDAFVARKIAIKKGTFTDQQTAAADVFPVDEFTGAIGGDGVDARDVLVFLRGLVGLLGPSIEISKHDIGSPIIVSVASSGNLDTSGTLQLTATVNNATAGEVTGVTWSIDAAATTAGFTVTPSGALTATLNAPTGGAKAAQTVVVTATPTGPGTTGRERTTAGKLNVAVTAHDQGGG